MGDEDRITGIERRIDKMDERLDKVVEALNLLTGNVSKMETQIEAMTNLLQERLKHHERETEARLDSHADRLAVLETKCRELEEKDKEEDKRIESLEALPDKMAAQKWASLMTLVWRVLAGVALAGVLIYLGLR